MTVNIKMESLMKKFFLFLLLFICLSSCGGNSSPKINRNNTNKMLLTTSQSPNQADWLLNKSEEYFLDNGEQLQIYSFIRDIANNAIDSSDTVWSRIPEAAGTFSVNPGSATVFNAAASGKYETTLKAACKGLERTMKFYIGYKIDNIKLSILSLKNNSIIVMDGDSLSIGATPMSGEKTYDKPVTINWSVSPTSVASLSAYTGSKINVTGLSAGTAVVTASINTSYGVIQSTMSVTVKDKMILFDDSYTPNNWYVASSQASNIELTLMSGGGGAPADDSKFLKIEFKTTSSSAELSYQFPLAEDVTGYTKLYFWARGSVAGQQFKFSTQGDSQFITLSTNWALYSLNLKSGITTVSNIFSVSPWFSSGVIYIDCIYLQ